MRKKDFKAFAETNGLDVKKTVKIVEKEIKDHGTNWNAVRVSIDSTRETPKVVFIPSGYRDKDTGEYVPKDYLESCGYKNTYYEKARLEISFPKPV
jgi:hypothetical protein